MPRQPVGTRPQPLSHAALAAHIASRLAAVRFDRRTRDEWLKHELGVKLRSNGLDRAASRARSAAVPWLLVDETELSIDLEKTLVVFPGRGRRRPMLLERLSTLGATRQLVVTRARRDVFCILLYRPTERDELFAAIEDFGEDFLWEDILKEDRRLEALAWTALARRVAREESLLEMDAGFEQRGFLSS